MKVTRLWIAVALLCAALLFGMAAPATNIAAQGGATATPAIVIITATPQGGVPVVPTAAATGPAAANVTPGAGGTPVPREWQALNVARAALTKKINKNLKYMTNWTWDLVLFQDSALGCPPQGVTPLKGPTAGYRITIQPLGDKNVYEYRVTFDMSKAYDCGIAGTAAGGTSLAGPVTGSVSGAFELGGSVYQLNAGTIAAMKTAKMKWVKFAIQPGDGNAINLINQAHAAGFKILLRVNGGAGPVLAAGFFDQLAAYMGSLAAAGADALVVWNEMNLDREWPNGQINPATYVQMLAKASAAIKAANKNTLVISGGLAPTGFAGAAGKSAAVWNDDVYYQEMAAAGAAQYIDCVGVHYNEGVVSPQQTSGDPRDSYPTRYFQTMLARAMQFFPGKQACFDELGFVSPEGYAALPAGFAWGQNTTVAMQAQFLAQAAVIASQRGVRLMIVWNVDYPNYGGNDPVWGYAIIRQGGACPACSALGAVIP